MVVKVLFIRTSLLAPSCIEKKFTLSLNFSTSLMIKKMFSLPPKNEAIVKKKKSFLAQLNPRLKS